MANLLYIKASPHSDEASKSTIIANYFLEEYAKKNPDDTIERLDLYEETIPLIDLEVLNAWKKLRMNVPYYKLTGSEKVKLTAINNLTEQFIQADKIVISSPLWNLGVPPLLKAYFDTISIDGRTFHYTKQGPVGWSGNKLAIHIHSRGGVYTGKPIPEYGDSYVTGILSFLGVEVLPSIIVEGLDHKPGEVERIMLEGKEQAIKAAGDFNLMPIY
ncbi:MAG: NAD(P)H-dependent oxidoreductase [Bacillus sp. (in: Bacteria)]|nr:NAD(P)H-dependent oxidoreductase [Bacillus sp. (in: firmicutes)]